MQQAVIIKVVLDGGNHFIKIYSLNEYNQIRKIYFFIENIRGSFWDTERKFDIYILLIEGIRRKQKTEFLIERRIGMEK